MRTTNAKTVAEALIQYFSRVGIPDEIVPDQGSNFMSKLVAQLYQGRSQDFSKGGSQTGTPSGDRRLYIVYMLLSLVYQRAQSYYRGLKAHIN